MGENTFPSKKTLYILGAGGMAREVYEMYKQANRLDEVKGFLVQYNKHKEQRIKDKKLFINDDILVEDKDVLVICAIGNPVRKEWVKSLEQKDVLFDEIIHSSVVLGKSVERGSGNIICAGSVITENVQIGNHVIINIGVTINHDSKIDDFTTISPGVHIAGNVQIEKEVFVGIGAIIKEGVKIGKNTFIGAGSLVLNDIPDNSLVYGSPARVVRKLSPNEWKTII